MTIDATNMTVEELEAAVRHHNHCYWDLAKPEIDDYEYDQLVEKLRELRPESPVLEEMGPSGVGQIGEAVKHATPMLSLDKCYAYREEDSTKQSLFNWAFASSRGCGEVTYSPRFQGEVVVTPKMDGIACSLRYDEDGVLHLAATRGNGKEGDNITANARTIADIPKVLDRPGVEVRGEIYMRLSVFEGFADQFSNPRNLTAGAIKQKDPLNTHAYRLSFAAYDLVGAGVTTEVEKFAELGRMGFPEMDHDVVDRDHLMEGYERIAVLRDGLDYEIDGVVYKVNRLDEQERLGATAHHPRHAIAYKFQGDQATTILREVSWSVARSGAITPVARVEPVTLSGASISRASLHNAGFLKKLDLLGRYPGAEVVITRRGGVIPKVEFVVKHVAQPAEGDEPIVYPEVCPSCGGEVDPRSNEEGDEFLFCKRPETCSSATIGALAHYAKALDIMGFGEKLLTQSYDQGLLRTPADFYTLEVGDLEDLERVGKILAEKLVNEVHSRKEVPLATFLRALSIDELSHFVSGELAERFTALAAVRQLEVQDLLIARPQKKDPSKIKYEAVIPGLGEKIVNKILPGLAAKSGLIDALISHLTVLDHVPEVKPTGAAAPLAGNSFVFTGALEQMTRKEAQQRVKALGAEAPSGVSAKLTYLVVGGDPEANKSSKQKKAEAYIARGAQTKIISEEDFIEMLTKDPPEARGQLGMFEDPEA